MRGRKPKPTPLQLAEGDPRKYGKGKLAEKLAAEPKAARGFPKCPDYLQGPAREAWEFWTEELAAMEMDRRADSKMLEAACVASKAMKECEEAIGKRGRFIARRVEDKDGNVHVLDIKSHPAARQQNAALLALKAICSEFGLSLVSRSRLSTDKKVEEEDDFMAILMQPREPRVPIPN